MHALNVKKTFKINLSNNTTNSTFSNRFKIDHCIIHPFAFVHINVKVADTIDTYSTSLDHTTSNKILCIMIDFILAMLSHWFTSAKSFNTSWITANKLYTIKLSWLSNILIISNWFENIKSSKISSIRANKLDNTTKLNWISKILKTSNWFTVVNPSNTSRTTVNKFDAVKLS